MPSPVAYFAFGANMDPRIFRGRRGMAPRRSETARLPGFRLAFNQPGLPIAEPAFANIEADPRSSVYGVLHHLDPDDLERLHRFEGSGDAYRHLDVTPIGYESGPVTACAYQSRFTVPGLRPSRRYLSILEAGGRAFALPTHYLHQIATHPSVYVPGSVALIHASDWLHGTGLINLSVILKPYWRARRALLRSGQT